MKNLEELKKIKERALQRRQMAGVDARARIVVAMGTTGIAAGARDTMSAILAELEKREIRDVIVTQTGGGGLSTYEPLIQVQIGDGDLVKYGNVDPARAVKIIESHIVKGQPIEEWVVK
ncbi:MAG: (2Fe-2S) ferredoxin domain-containing protein [Anaerolineae bacterium]|nr:(2Fe-2S) ferredoxin domain-containing protein [Anaerolineae bacterium]